MKIALETARQGIVLLKNDGVLPIPSDTTVRIAVIGGHAHVGVLNGTGSSAVVPPGGYAAVIKIGGPGVVGSVRNLYLFPSSPLEELKKLLHNAQVEFDPGMSPAEAALLAGRSDLTIVFGIRVEGEGFDLPDLSLPWGQDGVIEAVAKVNQNTIVILETGNPVSMPWKDRVKGIIEAWYPGQAGGQAIAEILTGIINPSGRLPITFPENLAQLPRPKLEGLGTPWPPAGKFDQGTSVTIRYDEGAEVGYRWFVKTRAKPLYAFGHGLTYTSFEYSDLHVSGGETITATFTVKNTGDRNGADVPQLYLTKAAGGNNRMRLLDFKRVELQHGKSYNVTMKADPRLLARYDEEAGQWQVVKGNYHVGVGKAADNLLLVDEALLTGRLFGR